MPRRAAICTDYTDLDQWCTEASALLWRLTTWVQDDVERGNRMFGLAKNQLWKIRRAELGLPVNANLPEEEREPIKKRAEDIRDKVMAGKTLTRKDEEDMGDILEDLVVFAESRRLCVKQRISIENVARKLARKFPIARWRKDHAKGFGELALCLCVGAAHNWDNYADVGKLLKRLGKAPFTYDGITRSCATWRKSGALPSRVWSDLEDGPKYNPRRSSILSGYIADSLLRAQWRGKDEETGEPAHAILPFGEIYGRYKERAMALNEAGAYADEAARQVAQARAKDKTPRQENLNGRLTAKHIHNRALVKMISALFKQALQEWHRETKRWRDSKEKPSDPPAMQHNASGDAELPGVRQDDAASGGPARAKTEKRRTNALVAGRPREPLSAAPPAAQAAEGRRTNFPMAERPSMSLSAASAHVGAIAPTSKDSQAAADEAAAEGRRTSSIVAERPNAQLSAAPSFPPMPAPDHDHTR